MSAIAINPINHAVRFYQAPIGKKAVMAVTGVVLFGYVVAHLLGNLQIYSSSPEQINGYAAFLHNPANVVPLWAVRAFLLAALILHIVASVQLWNQNRAARPLGYYKKADVPTSYAARTMIWSGPIVAAFVVFHILHLTVGTLGLPHQDVGGNPNTPDVHYNVIAGFQNPLVSGFYIFAMILLCMHLYHGLWSLFQSLGLSHPRYTPRLKKGAAIVAILIAIGNCSIPIAVMAGWLPN
jgi:succinate dehydrogenase / fumarate reductase cytochrome b subunit